MARTTKLLTKVPNNIRIISIDPGLSTLGWAISNLDKITGKFNVLKFGSIKASKNAIKQKELVETYGKQLVALNIINQEIKKLIYDSVPNYAVSEDAFYNPGTPNAFKSLLLCLNTIDNILFNISYYKEECNLPDTAKKLYKIPSKEVKKIMSGTGSSFKLDMLQALKDRMESGDIIISSLSNYPIESIGSFINEHEVDAISVGYAFAKNIYPTLIL